MIKVNLIPEEERKKVRRPRFKKPTLQIPGIDLILSIIFLLGMGGALWVINRSATNRLNELTNNIQETRKELQELQKERKIVEDIERRQNELKKWVSLVQNLNQGRSLYARLMNELNLLRPDYMWFESFEENGGHFRLNGKTFSNLIISNFMVKLDNSQYFTNIKLEEVNEKTQDEQSLLEFTLTGDINEDFGGGGA